MPYIAACNIPLEQRGWKIRCPDNSLSAIDVDTLLTTFDLSQLQPEIIAAAFGAGVTIVAVAEVTGIAVAAILNFIKKG
ncbi:MAG: hypothetical protein ABW146_06090 [Candidatus Sedimenticola sp. 6PFRAG7]